MRKLKLNREALVELGDADLSGIAGGNITHGCTLYPTYHDLSTCLKVAVVAPPRVTLNGCPWTGDPCLLTGVPPTHYCGG